MALKADPESELLRDWAQIAVIDTSELRGQLLQEWIHHLTDLTELTCIIKLVSNSRPRISLSDPGLIKELLLKAQSFSDTVFRDTEKDLYASIVNHGQSYRNGIPQNQTVLNQAREQREKNNADPLLYRLYDRAVGIEEARAEENVRRYKAHTEDSNQFH